MLLFIDKSKDPAYTKSAKHQLLAVSILSCTQHAQIVQGQGIRTPVPEKDKCDLTVTKLQTKIFDLFLIDGMRMHFLRDDRRPVSRTRSSTKGVRLANGFL